MSSSLRAKMLGLGVVAAAAVGSLGAGAAPAMAAEGITCSQGSGTLTLSPGLTETAKTQNLVAKGAVTGCGEKAAVAKFVVHLQSSGPVTCASVAAEGGSASGSALVKWGKKVGNSMASALLSGNLSGVSLTGSIESGPYAGLSYSTSLTGGTPVFNGVGAPCSKKNPLKTVTFTSGVLTVG